MQLSPESVKEQPDDIYKNISSRPLIILENTAVPFIISGSKLSVSSFLWTGLLTFKKTSDHARNLCTPYFI